MPKYKVVVENGIKFFFKYDDDAPDLLHIFARHLTSIDDALDVFFDCEATWNEAHMRFESYSKSHGIYWFWINETERKVMIISCFRLL